MKNLYGCISCLCFLIVSRKLLFRLLPVSVSNVLQTLFSFFLFFSDLSSHALCFSREKKDVRSLAALGVIYVVKTSWLEDCDHKKKEVPVLRRHIAYDLLQPKGLVL